MDANANKNFELFFGIVAPAGIDTKKTFNAIKTSLEEAQYKTHDIRLSKKLSILDSSLPKITNEGDRILRHMDAGNDARKKLERGDTVALLSLKEVKDIRKKELKGEDKKPAYGNAYVFNSLKHPDEIKSLKQIYGDHFFVISVYQPKLERIDNLTNKIKTSSPKQATSIKTKKAKEAAKKIIEKDEKDDLSYGAFGQNVRGTFPFADLFVNEEKQSEQIKRFIHLLFGARYVTPTRNEYGMQIAQTVAFKSADLSRQVGAVIISGEGSIVSAGCNEVPHPHIGTFWEGDQYEDHRDFKKAVDANVEKKNDLLRELFEKLQKKGWLNVDLTKSDPEKLVEKALYDPDHMFLKETRINNLLEFGRIVHAEMSAITDAARSGRSVLNSTLYCTTFPCHMCARHIIAAGIKKVIFIEPYPKSLTEELYNGMVKIDEGKAENNHVSFEAFIGVAPKQYEKLFKMLRRKDKHGNALPPEKIDYYPRIDKPDISLSYLNEEDIWFMHTKKLLS